MGRSKNEISNKIENRETRIYKFKERKIKREEYNFIRFFFIYMDEGQVKLKTKNDGY